ncbi:TIGR03757 family integrating conjugative element protein [Vreelandella zhaodongensis]|uniref:TIGR03757 family integrating conjugative element protein n=1 Tax=Vreelandella zhaodongensis TaxID=1176240 RepID=UPI003EB69F9F
MAGISSAAADEGQSVEVFTTAGEPVVNVPDGVPVIELDAPARLDAELSQELPADIDEAHSEMQSRMQSPEWRGKLQLYGDLYTGVARAWMLRVEKVPAVVVSSRYVIYGETDVAAAIARINDYLEQEGRP